MDLCPECKTPTLVSDGSRTECSVCGTVADEAPISSEIAFTETSGGASRVQGAYLSYDQNRPRMAGPNSWHTSGPGESRAATLSRAKRTIHKMGRHFQLAQNVLDKAERLFKMSMDGRDKDGNKINFVLGRAHELTVASCLYVACRTEERNTFMLIDFAQLLDINVFELGRSYLRLLRCVGFKTETRVNIIDPSIYIGRFCSMLNFNEETRKVASDATLLVKRFKFDWISQGRRPAGVCGAAIILAARMNNFRRSIAEVVQVVKIADVTLRKRLEEFKNTPSANLSVEDFRHVWLEQESNPPSFFLAREAKRKRIERKDRMARKALKLAKQTTKSVDGEPEDDDEDAQDEDAASSSRRNEEKAQGSNNDSGGEEDEDEEDEEMDDHVDPELDRLATEATELEVRGALEEDGIRELNAELEEEERQRTRRAQLGRLGPYRAPPTDLPLQNPVLDATKALIESQKQLSKEEHRKLQASQGYSESAKVDSSLKLSSRKKGKQGDTMNDEVEIGAEPVTVAPAEVEDDLADLDEEELDRFILTQEEAALKERVWIEFNKDYLEAELTKQLKEEADIRAGIPIKRKVRRNKKKGAPVLSMSGDTPAASVRNMVEQKGSKISKKINYAALGKLMGEKKDVGRAGKTAPSDAEDDDASDGERDEDGNLIIEEEGLPPAHPKVRKESAHKHRQKSSAKKGKAGKRRIGESGTDSELDAGHRLSDVEGGTATEAETETEGDELLGLDASMLDDDGEDEYGEDNFENNDAF